MKLNKNFELLPTTYAHGPCEYAVNPTDLGDREDSQVVQVSDELAVEMTAAVTPTQKRQRPPVENVSLTGLDAIIKEGDQAKQTLQKLNCGSCVLALTQDCKTHEVLISNATLRSQLARTIIEGEVSRQKVQKKLEQERIDQAERTDRLVMWFGKWRHASQEISQSGKKDHLLRKVNTLAASYMQEMLCIPNAAERDQALKRAYTTMQLHTNPQAELLYCELITNVISEVTVYEQLVVVAKENTPQWNVRFSDQDEDIKQGFDILVEVPWGVDGAVEVVRIDVKSRNEFDKLMKKNNTLRSNSYMGVKPGDNGNILVINPYGQNKMPNPSIFKSISINANIPTFRINEPNAKDFRERLQKIADKRSKYLQSLQRPLLVG